MKNIDGTIYAQKAISAVLRTNLQLTLTSLNEVLRGVESKTVVDAGFNRIKTFGAGADLSATQWRYYLIQMLVKGVLEVDYDNKFRLKVTEFGYRILDGTEKLELVAIQERAKKTSSESETSIVFRKVQYLIDPDIRHSIKWTSLLAEVASALYWNKRETTTFHLSTIIPEDVNNRQKVVERFKEILKESLHVNIDGEVVQIPVRHDHDSMGNIVELPVGSFEEILTKFRAFVDQNNKFPLLNTSYEETSLRKWYMEVGHGIIPISQEQQALYDKLREDYKDIPKTLYPS